jgi:hypothetical protein
MGNKLKPEERELYRRCDEVLHYVWDPIGVAEYPGARDEYHMYLPQVFSLVKDGAPEEKIVSFLVDIEVARMGLAGNAVRAQKTAETLIRWWTWIRRHAAEQGVDDDRPPSAPARRSTP